MAMTLTLIFTLGDELYGLEIDAVQEIIENPVVHYVPRASGVVEGAINFHGQILAAIDLPALLGFASEQRDHRRVVLTADFKSLALSVNGIQRIVELDLTALEPPPASSQQKAIRGVAQLDGTEINLLDKDGVINQLENLHIQ
jgi:purine-binding chemotaxis protein CheW